MYGSKKLFTKFQPAWVNVRSWIALVLSVLSLIWLVDIDDQLRQQSFYAAPIDLEQVIAETKQSLVTVFCGDFLGSGWVMDIQLTSSANSKQIALSKEFPSWVVTNYHVVEDCLKDASLPKSAVLGANKMERDIEIWNFNEENDIALVVVKAKLKPLVLATETPQGGWWTMAIGSPWELNSSVSIGNLISADNSITEYDLITTSLLNPGNSGGPLINSRGEVIGTNTWGMNDADAGFYNVATNTDAVCLLINC